MAVVRFVPDPQGVDPTKVQFRTLANGAKLPAVGLGTFGSDRFSGEEVAEAVRGALKAGYRHIDCASVYANEHLIGPVLKEAIDGGLPRSELFITSKANKNRRGENHDGHHDSEYIP